MSYSGNDGRSSGGGDDANQLNSNTSTSIHNSSSNQTHSRLGDSLMASRKAGGISTGGMRSASGSGASTSNQPTTTTTSSSSPSSALPFPTSSNNLDFNLNRSSMTPSTSNSSLNSFLNQSPSPNPIASSSTTANPLLPRMSTMGPPSSKGKSSSGSNSSAHSYGNPQVQQSSSIGEGTTTTTTSSFSALPDSDSYQSESSTNEPKRSRPVMHISLSSLVNPTLTTSNSMESPSLGVNNPNLNSRFSAFSSPGQLTPNLSTGSDNGGNSSRGSREMLEGMNGPPYSRKSSVDAGAASGGGIGSSPLAQFSSSADQIKGSRSEENNQMEEPSKTGETGSSMSGLGIGFPSSRNEQDSNSRSFSTEKEGSFSTFNQGLRGGVGIGKSASMSTFLSSSGILNNPPPQTPDRRFLDSQNQEFGSGSQISTPAGPTSPMDSYAYDRAGQIGIGELSTPRWNFPASSVGAGWSQKDNGGPNSKPKQYGGSSYSSSVDPLASGTPTASSKRPKETETDEKKERIAVAKRHSRAISYSAAPVDSRSINSNRGASADSPVRDSLDRSTSTSGGSKMFTSPSVPANSLGGVSSLSSLARGFESSSSEFIAELSEFTSGVKDRHRFVGEGPMVGGPGGGTSSLGDGLARGDSPTYSISARSESVLSGDETGFGDEDEDENERGLGKIPISKTLIDTLKISQGSQNRSAGGKSPRIGDSAWSNEETGPFGGGGGGFGDSSGFGMESSARDTDQETYASERGSYDLSSAINDLLKEDLAKRKGRQSGSGKAVLSETDDSRRSSMEETLASNALNQPQDYSFNSGQIGTSGASRELPLSKRAPLTAQARAHEDDRRNRSGSLSNATRRSTETGRSSATTLKDASSSNASERDSRRRSRHASSPGQPSTATSTSSSSMASPARSSRVTSAVYQSPTSSKEHFSATKGKRASSTSIAHSLLRGSMPLGAADEFEGILEQKFGAPVSRDGREDDTAEALRKLDGLSNTPRSSRDGKETSSSKSPRTSRQYARPGSAGRRTPGSASRGSSPARPSKDSPAVGPTTNSSGGGPTPGRSERRSEDRKSLRASSRNRNATDDSSITTPISTTDSPRASTASFSSPRARKSQLPPMPTVNTSNATFASANFAGALSSPTMSTHPASKRASAASFNSTSTNADRSEHRRPSSSNGQGASTSTTSFTRTSSKSKRASDASSIQSQDFQRNDGGSAPLSPEIDESSSQAASNNGGGNGSGIFIPPVPPLPKAWESSRTASIMSPGSSNPTGTPSPAQPSPSSFNQGTTSSPSAANVSFDKNTTPSSPALSSSTVNSQPAPSRKWSMSNIANAITRSPSTRKLDDSFSGRNPSNSSATAKSRQAAAQVSQYPSSSETSLSIDPNPSRGQVISGPASPASTSADNSNANATPKRRQPSGTERLSSSPHSYPQSPSLSQSQSFSQSQSQTPTSPKVRRTPSFFHKSSPASKNSVDSSSGPRSSGEKDKGSNSNSSEKDSEKRDVTTTPNGRSSRKSILGLGGLLRSSSRKASNSSSTNSGGNSIKMPSSKSQDVGLLSPEVPENQGISPKVGSRRSSFMGRKRGKVSDLCSVF